MKLVLLICIATVATACTRSALGACKIVQVAQLNVSNTNNRPVVDGKIEGRDVEILIDTGSSFSFVFQDAATRLGLPLHGVSGLRVFGVGGEAQAYSTLVKQLQFGSFTIKDLPLVVIGKRREDRPQAPALVLGEDFLSNYTTEFDLAHGVILLLRPEGCRYDQLPYWAKTYSLSELEPMRADDPQIGTEVLINGKRVSAHLDTGSRTSIISSQAAHRVGSAIGLDDQGTEKTVNGIAEKPVQSSLAEFDSLSIGDETIHNVKLRIANLFGRDTAMETGSHISKPIEDLPDMLIGNDFFRSHRVMVLPQEHKLLFTYEGGPIFQVIEPDDRSEQGR